MELLVDNLSRLNEDEEADRQGVFHVLGQDTCPMRFASLTSYRYLRELTWLQPRSSNTTSLKDKDSILATESDST